MNAEDKVEARSIKIGRAHGPLRAVLKGLKPEDRVVVNGLMMLRPGVKVVVQTPESKAQSEQAAAPTDKPQAKALAVKFSHFFIRRPIFASVLSILIVLLGVIALFTLPIAQYPEITPPTIFVIASYPGASADTVANTVATPLEEQINGVENMLYMSAQCSSDGQMRLAVTFKVGTDPNTAQVLVQNRVDGALPRLPEEVRTLGVITRKRSPTIAMLVSLDFAVGQVRPGLSEQLCLSARAGRAGPAAGRGRLDHLWRAGLLHAHLD